MKSSCLSGESLWHLRISAVRLNLAVRVIRHGQRASVPSANPAPSLSTDRYQATLSLYQTHPLFHLTLTLHIDKLFTVHYPLLLCFMPGWVNQCHVLKPQKFLLQKYRHVDNIMFENHTIADRFLDFWRKTGNQRMGYLYGRYTEHKDIPLGLRAEVAAIYEPPQVRDSDLTQICFHNFSD